MKSFITIALLVLLIGLGPGVVWSADTLTLNDGSIINLSGTGINLTVNGNTTIDSMTVDTTSITLTLDPGDKITLRSDDGRKLSNNIDADTTCVGSGISEVVLQIADGGSQTSVVVTPGSVRECSTSSSGGGGGGGGGGGSAPSKKTGAISVSPSAGRMLTISGSAASYAVGNNGMRYVYPHENVFKSWFSDFSDVEEVAKNDLIDFKLAGNVTIRSGTHLVQFVTNETPFRVDDPNVYAVEPGGLIRHITTSEIARQLYGSDWETRISPQVNTLFANYTVGDPITSAVYPSGSIVKEVNSDQIYYIEGTVRRAFASDSAFEANRFNNSFVIETSLDISSYPFGVQITGKENKLSTVAGPF